MAPRSGALMRLLPVGILLACGGDSAGPDDDQPGAATSVTAVSGGSQTGVVGSVLPLPVVAKVTDAKGRAVPGVAVSFRIDSGNGTLAPALDTTDAAGQAQATWTLGTNSSVEQRVTATAAALVPASFTATAQTGPAAGIEKLTQVGCAVPGASGARDLTIKLTDTYGNPVNQGRVDWTTLGGGSVSPATSNTGVDGRATTRWTAGSSGDQSVTAAVAALPAAVFSAQLATTRIINRGEVLTLTDAAMHCNDFAAGNGARYLVAVTNITPNTSASSFGFNGGLMGAGSTLSAPVTQIDGRAQTARGAASAEARQAQLEARVHQRNQESNAAIIRALAAASSTAAIRPSSSVLAASAPPPNVGDTLTMRVPNLNAGSCTVPKAEIRARVIYVGTRSVVMEDVAAPLAGTMDDLYRQLGQEYDNVMWDILNANFGSPTAFDASLDANDRIFMLFTKHVNDLGAAGFVSSADFYPRSRCQISNVGEVFYAGVPLTTGGFSDPDSRDNFLRRTRTVVIHESKHLVAYAHRFQRANGNPQQSDLEDSWLEEASAMVAEELWARTVYGYAQLGNANYRASLYCEVRPSGWPECGPDVKPRAMFDHFGFLYEYELDIEKRSPLGQTGSDDFSWYGSAWLLLRYAIDHSGTAENIFLRTLTQETAIHGVANLQARAGRAFPDLITDWTLSLALDDRAGFTPPRTQLTVPSWNLSDMFAGLFADFGNQGVVQNPLAVRNVQFGNFAVDVGQLRGGTMAIFEITGPQAGRQLLELRTTTPGNLRFTVVRLD